MMGGIKQAAEESKPVEIGKSFCPPELKGRVKFIYFSHF